MKGDSFLWGRGKVAGFKELVIARLDREGDQGRSVAKAAADAAIQSAERLRGIRLICAADAAQLDSPAFAGVRSQ